MERMAMTIVTMLGFCEAVITVPLAQIFFFLLKLHVRHFLV